jgi:hypothetical protein
MRLRKVLIIAGGCTFFLPEKESTKENLAALPYSIKVTALALLVPPE